MGIDETLIILEVIVPSSNIELPISRDEVNESNKSADEVEQQTEIRSDEDDNERDRNVNIPSNRIEEEEEMNSEGENRGEEENEEAVVDNGRDENEIELTEEDLEDLAKDLGKGVFENVMNKASEFGGSKWESEASDDDNNNGVDPNSVAAQAEIPSDSGNSGVEVVEAEEDLDGVVLPDEELSEEELARIAAESSKPKEPVVPQAPTPSSRVRGGRIGSGVQPDSASQHNVLIQFITVALVFLLL
ncbi:hypothetical protein GCK72_013427 [Caenorhabditis remanei]|uniref:Uncharacterized protein n=1 Tax=Caenorhabditis remanei TaxID=31234 RepID=A0A6A5GRH3_CAERE|nr:hypothetical protein GCK72_013427 [Caenorhabditis remanei]KAF1756972.1 hypothetical protein GCK72_013427 [Caenorhabditis remanei]